MLTKKQTNKNILLGNQRAKGDADDDEENGCLGFSGFRSSSSITHLEKCPDMRILLWINGNIVKHGK